MRKTLFTLLGLTASVFCYPQTILFEELFDDANVASRGWYDNTSVVISTAEHIPGSTGSAEFKWQQGAILPTTGGTMRRLFTPSDSVYVSFWIKYSANFTGSNKPYHPHEFYLLTTESSNYTGPAYTRLTAYIEQNEGRPMVGLGDGVNIDVSKINQDLTNVTEDRGVCGCNGIRAAEQVSGSDCYVAGSGEYRNGKTWKGAQAYFSDNAGPYYKNDWHHIEVFFKLNTISNGKGNADGVVSYRYDDQVLIERTNIIMRTALRPTIKFNQFLIGPYIGDGSPVTQTFWVDNLTVSTGPGGGTSCGGNAPSLSSSSTPDNCGNADGTATVNPTGGSGSYTYLWSNGATSLTANGLPAGIYTITVTDTDGCSATDNVAVGYTACYSGICLEGEAGTLSSPAESVADATVSQNAYMQTTAGESGTVAYTFNVDTPGTYKLTARVYAADDGSDSWYFYFDNEIEDIWDFNPTGDASLFGVWYQDELAKRGTGSFDNPEKDPYLIYLTQGSHTFNMRGREAQAKLDYFCLERQIATGAEDREETGKLVVYPNPTTGELRITNDELRMKNGDFGLMTLDLRLFDIYGKVVLENQLPTTNYQLLDLSHLPAGVYFLTVTTSEGTVTEKVVKY